METTKQCVAASKHWPDSFVWQLKAVAKKYRVYYSIPDDVEDGEVLCTVLVVALLSVVVGLSGRPLNHHVLDGPRWTLHGSLRPERNGGRRNCRM